MGSRYNNKSHYGYRNTYYNNASVAYDYEPHYYPKQEQPKIIETVSTKELIVQRRSLAMQRLRLIACVLFVFAGCIMTMVVHTTVEEQRINNVKLQDKLASLQNSNNMLNSEITEQLSLDYIEKEATTRLGMSEPQLYQICYIDVPKQSYTVQYDVAQESTNSFTFDLSAVFDSLIKD